MDKILDKIETFCTSIWEKNEVDVIDVEMLAGVILDVQKIIVKKISEIQLRGKRQLDCERMETVICIMNCAIEKKDFYLLADILYFDIRNWIMQMEEV